MPTITQRDLKCFILIRKTIPICTVYPKKYAHGFCFAVLCCGYTLTDFPISIRLTSLALWQSNDCPSTSKATLMNMDKYFMWTHYERLHNHNKAKHNKTVCIFLGIYCMMTCCRVPRKFQQHTIQTPPVLPLPPLEFGFVLHYYFYIQTQPACQMRCHVNMACNPWLETWYVK